MTEIFHSQLRNSERKEEGSEEQRQKVEEEAHVGLKRKFDNSHCSEEQGDGDDPQHENEQVLKDVKLKKAKNVCFSFFDCVWL